MSATWHDPLSVPPEPADAPEHTGGGKLYMRRHDGSLRNPTGRELEEHGHHGVAPVDVEQREDDWQRWLTRVQDDVNAGHVTSEGAVMDDEVTYEAEVPFEDPVSLLPGAYRVWRAADISARLGR